MRALPNERWRVACMAFCHGIGKSSRNNYGYVEALKAAGWEGTEGSLRVSAHRIFHDHRMQAAVIEESKKAFVGLVPLARDKMEEILQTPGHPKQFDASRTILDRAGIVERREEHVTHEITMSPENQQRVALLAKRLGIPVQKLVGNRQAPVIEAEYAEVKPLKIEVEYIEVPIKIEDIL